MQKIKIIILLFLLIGKLHGATWENTPYIDQLILESGNSINAVYNTTFPYPHIAFLCNCVTYNGVSNTTVKKFNFVNYNMGKNWWDFSEVDKNISSVAESSLQIDKNGSPHISYTDWNSEFLKYAYKDELGWQLQVLDNSPMTGRFNCIQLDKKQNVHIAYFDAKNGSLKYIYYNGFEWIKEIIDQAPNKMLGLFLSFKIDKNGEKHISYYDGTDDNLKYAYNNGEQWFVETLDTTGITGLYGSLELDSNNLPHITYYSNGILKYMYKTNFGLWKKEIVDIDFGSGMYQSKLILDKDNRKHIFYIVSKIFDKYAIRYAYYNGEIWILKNIISMAGNKSYDFNSFSILQDINDEFILLYSVYASINYKGPSLSPWAKTYIDNNVDDTNFSFVYDKDSNPYFVYAKSYYYNYRFTGNELKYAYFNNTIINSETILRRNLSQGAYSNMDVFWRDMIITPILQMDTTNFLHLAYYDRIKYSISGKTYETTYLKYLQRKNNIWEQNFVKKNISNSNSIAFVIDKLNNPFISYYGSDNIVETMSYYNSNWNKFIIENAKYPGECALAVDSQNKVHLAYTKKEGLVSDVSSFLSIKNTGFINNALQNTETETIYRFSNNDSFVNDSNYYPYINLKIHITEKNTKELLFWGNSYYPGYFINPIVSLSNKNKVWENKRLIESGILFSDFVIDKDKKFNLLVNYSQSIQYEKYDSTSKKVSMELVLLKNNYNYPKSNLLLDLKNNPFLLVNEINVNDYTPLGDLYYYTKLTPELKIASNSNKTFNFTIDNLPKYFTIVKYLWNFGIANGIDITTVAPNASFTYSTGGTYYVRVIVISESGARGVGRLKVTVN